MPRSIGTVLSLASDKATTLHLLETTLSLEDVYDLMEVASIDAHNSRMLQKYMDKDKG